jgi:hypothetical protein
VKENWDVVGNHVSCVLGAFCHKYKERYGTDYAFVPRGPNPFSEKECRDAHLMIATFGGDAHEVRRYIVWAFGKGLGSNIKITSLAYLNAPGLVRKYKLYAEKKHVLTRSSPLPSAFVDWCKQSATDIFLNYALETMNDLGALLNYVTIYNHELLEHSVEKQVIKKAAECLLVKDGKLNIARTE